MVREIPAIRILPMSDKIPGFRGRGIEDVQKRCFLTSLPAMKGRYRYRSTGLNGEPGTVVLFQFRPVSSPAASFFATINSRSPRVLTAG